MPAELVSGEVSLLDLQVATFLQCPHTAFSLCASREQGGEREKEQALVSPLFSYKDTGSVGLESHRSSLIQL